MAYAVDQEPSQCAPVDLHRHRHELERVSRAPPTRLDNLLPRGRARRVEPKRAGISVEIWSLAVHYSLFEHSRDAVAFVTVVQVGKAGQGPEIGDGGRGSRVHEGVRATTLVAEPPDRDEFSGVRVLPQDEEVAAASAVQRQRVLVKYGARSHRGASLGSS